ncbi:MAG: hypothetical protein AB1510_12550 [Bacillota bacterium]
MVLQDVQISDKNVWPDVAGTGVEPWAGEVSTKAGFVFAGGVFAERADLSCLRGGQLQCNNTR